MVTFALLVASIAVMSRFTWVAHVDRQPTGRSAGQIPQGAMNNSNNSGGPVTPASCIA